MNMIELGEAAMWSNLNPVDEADKHQVLTTYLTRAH